MLWFVQAGHGGLKARPFSLDIPEAGIKGMAGGRAAVPRAMGSILLAEGEGQQGSILPSSTLWALPGLCQQL